MRESRKVTSIQSSPATQRAKQLRCDRKKEHIKESLSYICVTPLCKSKGLICIKCKTSADHTGHTVLPLKSFLAKVEEALSKNAISNTIPNQQKQPPFESKKPLEKLEEAHIQILATLRLQIQEISEKIRKCEEDLMKQYNQTLVKIHQQLEKSSQIKSFLQQIQLELAEERQSQETKIKLIKLISLLKVQKNDFIINSETEVLLNKYLMFGTTFKNNMVIWERESHCILNQIFKVKAGYDLKQPKVRPTTALDPATKAISLTFSPAFKSQLIILTNQNKVTKIKEDKQGQLVLANERLFQSKTSSIKLKISALAPASTMQIGVAIKAHVALKNYKFEKNTLAHGTWMASSNGIQYVNNEPKDNNTKLNLAFKNNDQIVVQADLSALKLIFKKKNDNKTYEINLKGISQNDLKQLYFCACINGINDKLQIVG